MKLEQKTRGLPNIPNNAEFLGVYNGGSMFQARHDQSCHRFLTGNPLPRHGVSDARVRAGINGGEADALGLLANSPDCANGATTLPAAERRVNDQAGQVVFTLEYPNRSARSGVLRPALSAARAAVFTSPLWF